jgi:hypothetical protein
MVRVKITYNNSARRFALEEPASFAKLVERVQAAFNLQGFLLRYKDDENELITLASQDDMDEAVLLLEEMGQPVLKIVVIEDENMTASPTSSAEGGDIDEKEDPLPSIREILFTLLELSKEDEDFRQDLPEAARIIVQAWADRDFQLKAVVESILENCHNIANNEFVAGLDLLNNWDRFKEQCSEREHCSPFMSFGAGNPGAPFSGPLGRIACNPGLFPMFAGFGAKANRVFPTFESELKTESPREPVLNSYFIDDLTLPDGVELRADEGKFHLKSWLIGNSGTEAWPEGTELVLVGGDEGIVFGTKSFPVPLAAPGEEVEVSALLRPVERGHFKTTFRLKDPKGNEFGHWLWADVNVV